MSPEEMTAEQPEAPRGNNVAVGPETTVVQILLGSGAFLIVPLSNEDILRWSEEIRRRQSPQIALLRRT